MKILIKIWGLCILTGLSSSESSAQSSSIVLDSISIAMRNLQTDNELTPPSIEDPAHGNQKVELNVLLYLKNASKVKGLQLNYGNTNGSSNLANIPLTYLNENGNSFLVYQNRKFPIVNNKVTITQLVPIALIKQVAYITLKAQDSNNLFSNTLTKKFN